MATKFMSESILIIGAGFGLSLSLARMCFKEGMKVSLASRNINKLKNLSSEINANLYKCDASKIKEVENLFYQLDNEVGTPDLVVYNPSARVRGAVTDVDPVAAKEAINITSFGAFLVAQQSARRMLKRGSGSIFFTGASAGVKGFPNSSIFAMGKFGLRGLAQSLARELHPKNIHIGHFIIDGGIKKVKSYQEVKGYDDNLLDPDEIASSYLTLHRQHRSSWAWEIELRPWVENF